MAVTNGGQNARTLDWNGEPSTDQPYRPVLTKLIRGVVTGKIKCVIVWSVDRLLREIAIAKIMADLFAKHGCLLYDRNGNVPLDSPEARGNFFQTVLAAQQYREMCAVNSHAASTNCGSAARSSSPAMFWAIGMWQRAHQSRDGRNRACPAHLHHVLLRHEQGCHCAPVDGRRDCSGS